MAKYEYKNGLTVRITRASSIESEEWYKNFETIEELMEFVQDNGSCILTPPKPQAWGREVPYYAKWELLIYDDWIE